MGDLVQEGYDGQASVKVVLVNEGTDAARPEIYGDKITIERKFSRRGPAKLLLLGADGQVKSKGKDVKKELRYILDALKVSVDNPVCVLDQENSKHFIRGKAREKYKFFLKATEIDDVQQRIARVNQAASKCLSDAEHQRSRLEGFARLYMQARDEYDEVTRLAMSVRRADLSRTHRGAAAAATRISPLMHRGDAAATTWIFRGDGSRRRPAGAARIAEGTTVSG